MNGSAQGSAIWSETKDPKTGRPYFWNKQTNQTSWNRPDDLLTPSQRATGWTQTSTPEGKLYWFNKSDNTKTSWTAPPGWEDSAPQRDEPPQYVSSSFNYSQREQPRDRERDRDRDYGGRDDYRRDRPYDSGGYRGPIANSSTGYENASQAEREAVFNKLLKKVGVQAEWTWERTIKAAVQDPAFRALAEPSERKDAFEQYKADMKKEEAKLEQERLAKLEIDFRNMLSRHPEVTHYSRWKTVRPIVEGETAFRSTDSEDERKRLFESYVEDLKMKHQEKRFEDHKEAMQELSGVMRSIDITSDTSWDEAQNLINNSETFAEEKFETLTRSEVLDAFISHIRRLWDDVNSIKQQNKLRQVREARKARDDFHELLVEWHNKDILQANTSWQSILGTISQEPQYEALVANARSNDSRINGSTPLDMFLDFVDDLDAEAKDMARDAEALLKTGRIRLDEDLDFADFSSAIKQDKKLAGLSQAKSRVVYERIMASLALSAEESREAQKRQEKRRAIDALRSRIKHLEPPVTLDDSWEVIRPRVERLEEYAALESDADRRTAFDKHFSRLQDDAERDRRHRGSRREKDGHRDRSRESHRGGRRRSRTPPSSEMNAYAEDRRRAIEQRERLYRHASGGERAAGGGTGGRHGSVTSGLSPPPRERGRWPEYMRKASLDDPTPGPRRSDRYERERRDAEAERERAYVSRADPHSRGGGELDYGDDGGSSAAPERKRSGDLQNGGGGKRPRLDYGDEEMDIDSKAANGHGKANGNKDKDKDKEHKEEVAMQSGSEEGEIEEV